MEFKSEAKLGSTEEPAEVSREHDRDIIEWMIFNKKTTEKELIEYLKLTREQTRKIMERLISEKVVERKQAFLPSQQSYNVNYNSEYVKEMQGYLKPSIALIGGERKFMTSLDLLKGLVDKFGYVELSKAAKYFNTEESKMEKLAGILQEQGLMTLNYPILGEPILMRAGEGHTLFSKSAIVKIEILMVLAIMAYFAMRIFGVNLI
jgi:hypothetical protein